MPALPNRPDFRRTTDRPLRCASLGLLLGLAVAGQTQESVRLWETNLVLPTYRVAPPDPNPRFYQGRTYQGARAPFYPYPVTDRLTDEKVDRTYRAVGLENRYLELLMLPELGGRIFSARDRRNGYDFFYRQHVIKPALIGMLGAWISGGVEWNIPHHHRATSFAPVEWTATTGPDGRRTVWVGETEWRHRLRWIVGLTLHPDRSYLELTVKVFNRTAFAHSLLFWINPAVHANEQYQVLFPPDTQFAVQHGKPEFAHWPIAREVYGGTDYTRGVDISWWKNHPSPVSFFCFHSDMDFFGGYDHGRRAGVLHVADHHQVPGKKFFEWGVGAEGQRWSEILTDTDGPYLELMAGAYSDNQPDYSWLGPGETRTWTHYWYPIRELGGAKNATPDAALNLEVHDATARLALEATTAFADARIRLQLGDRDLLDLKQTVDPEQPFVREIPLPDGADPATLRASLTSADGRERVAYRPLRLSELPRPEPAHRPRPPTEIPTSEELVLTGLRIEQLYSPSFEPEPYYEEAIRRDPGDARANTALGIRRCRTGRWAEAEELLRTAIARTTAHYIRPKDTEAFYYLGVTLRARGRFDEAYDAFSRAVWNLAWQPAGHLALAEIDARRGRFASALAHVERALTTGADHTHARNLRSAILRHLERAQEAVDVARGTLTLDPLDLGAAYELALALEQVGQGDAAQATRAELQTRGRDATQSWLEVATDYENAGLWTEAIALLDLALDGQREPRSAHPLVFYHLGYAAEQAGRVESLKFLQHAARLAPDFCFPFRLEEERILRHALGWNPEDARAWYYLGNLLYDLQPEEAIAAWEKSRELKDDFALLHRNLGLAYAQTRRDPVRAIASLERAVELNPREPRFRYELDVQYEAASTAVPRRLEQLERHRDVVGLRDDALTRLIQVWLAAGEPARALEVLTTHRFHNWEGSSEIHGLYVAACLERGHQQRRAGDVAAAIRQYAAALEYPANLEVGRPKRDRQGPQIHYYLGLAESAAGNDEAARHHFAQAVEPRGSGASENAFCQALALARLGQADEARKIGEGLVQTGRERLVARESPDYFAKFGERQSERVRQADAHFLMGLGELGLGRTDEARAAFAQALQLHPAHLGALSQLRELPAEAGPQPARE